MSDVRIPSTPKVSAVLIGWGVFLVLGGVPVILAAAMLVGVDGDPLPVVWIGLIVTIVGAVLLAVGAFRVAEHADRAAGVRSAYANPQASSQVN